MAFRIQDFRSQMVFDGARPNLFEFSMTFPIIAIQEGDPQRKFTFMARAGQLPGSTVNQIPVNYFGRELKFSGNRTFSEWTVTIINDEDFVVRKAFERWMNGLNGHVGNLRDPTFVSGTSAIGGYSQDIYAVQYGKTGGEIKAYRFVGAFPIDVSPIELDWGANDSIEEFAVTFAYQWWESDDQLATTDTSGA